MLNFFNKIIDVLEKENIQYMLSGSIAMGLYVLPRATRDFDFIIHINENKINDFANNFLEGFYCNVESIKEAYQRQSIFNIIDHESGYKADFVILKNNNFRQEEFNRRQQVNCFDRKIWVVTAEDLLISKIIWIQDLYSNIQAEDIKCLLALPTLEIEYVEQWINKLKLNTFKLISKK